MTKKKMMIQSLKKMSEELKKKAAEPVEKCIDMAELKGLVSRGK